MKAQLARTLRSFADAIEYKKAPYNESLEYKGDHLFPERYLVRDYFETHAEAHRYYPTSMEWPCYVIHMGRRLIPREDADTRHELENFLCNSVKGKWSRRIPNSPKERTSPVYCLKNIDIDFIRRFSGYYTRASDDGVDADKSLGEVLAIDCCPIVDKQPKDLTQLINARIELHREYISLTIFIPLDVKVQPKEELPSGSGPAARIDAIDVEGVRLACLKSASGTEALLRLLYDALPHEILKYAPSGAPDSVQSALGALVREFTAGWYDGKSAEAASKKGGGIFCVFHGAVLPSNWLEVWCLEPALADPSVVGKWRPEKESLERTITFLNRFWFLAKSSVYKTGLHDLVANFMRNGSVIYTSNIGTQVSPESKDYLRFLVIYKSTQLQKRPSVFYEGPEDDDECAKSAQAMKRYLNESYKIDEPFWISRIVSRLLTMGTLRLMAISDLKLINNAMQQLGQLEIDLSKIEQRAPSESGQYKKLYKQINKRMKRMWTGNYSLIARLSYNKVAFQSMKRQLDDLEITRIPGWQSYDAFINRRLVTTYERISEISDRYNDIWRVIRSRMEVIETGTTLRLTSIARDVGFAALAASLTDSTKAFARQRWTDFVEACDVWPFTMIVYIGKCAIAWLTSDIVLFLCILLCTYLVYGLIRLVSGLLRSEVGFWRVRRSRH